MRRRWAGVVAATAVLLVTASGALAVAVRTDGPGDPPGMRGMPGMMHGSGPGMPGAMPGMMHGSGVGNEYTYLVEMVAHHQEAIDSAGELRRSDRAEMRAFGESIVASQSAQVEQMEGWLGAWYQDRSGRADYEPMMRDLSGLSGDRLDRAFLQDMVHHHMMAVMMSHQLLRRDVAEHPEVATLARTIRDEQRAEIAQMHQWLRQWFGQGWQHGHDRGDAGRPGGWRGHRGAGGRTGCGGPGAGMMG